MKIAAISDDGITISQHFGRAKHYVVVTIEDKQVVARETRDKMGHSHFANEPHPQENDPRGHGYDAAAQSRHAQMAGAIADCEALIVRGMGSGAYDSMRTANIRPIVTSIPTIDDAVKAYLDGTLVDHVELLH
jgi:predicted Fe-Mo cluster-binding NifX family protein